MLPKNEENIHSVQQWIWKRIFQLYWYYRYKTQLYSSPIMYHQTMYVFINLSMWIGSFNGKSQQKCFSCSYKWRLMISMLYLMLKSSITRFLWCIILPCTVLATMCLFKQLGFTHNEINFIITKQSINPCSLWNLKSYFTKVRYFHKKLNM